ncbi:MAG TPA: decaprenyl-phosphate phosphoribosyltransferase [bacterium]|nr:decaprenyl-phosphate phosphoribosyltransferase [bacterium]HQQ00305.1 decaprenyl-phosphate phosphoribosyltransferase [bacterium]
MQNSSDRVAGWNVLFASLRETARIKQWIKNLFVFAPLVFSHGLFSVEPCSRAFAAFFIFCLFSSSVYFLNDVVDIERDRLHPQKCRRPLPSGRLSIRAALVASCTLLCLAILLSLVVFDIRFLAIGLTYIAINVAYSFRLKSVVLLDGMSIAAGFVLRAFAGAFAIGAMMSDWLYLCALLISLFLAFCKRRHELALLEEAAANHRGILEDYPIQFLDQLISILTAATLVCYSLYTLDREVTQPLRFGGGLKLTIPFVIYGLLRYQFLVHRRQEGGNPTDLLLRDKPLMVNFALWLVFVLCIIYS